jgi:hypothetical protein
MQNYLSCTFKGTPSQIRPALQWYHWIGLGKDIRYIVTGFVVILILNF